MFNRRTLLKTLGSIVPLSLLGFSEAKEPKDCKSGLIKTECFNEDGNSILLERIWPGKTYTVVHTFIDSEKKIWTRTSVIKCDSAGWKGQLSDVSFIP